MGKVMLWAWFYRSQMSTISQKELNHLFIQKVIPVNFINKNPVHDDLSLFAFMKGFFSLIHPNCKKLFSFYPSEDPSLEAIRVMQQKDTICCMICFFQFLTSSSCKAERTESIYHSLQMYTCSQGIWNMYVSTYVFRREWAKFWWRWLVDVNDSILDSQSFRFSPGKNSPFLPLSIYTSDVPQKCGLLWQGTSSNIIKSIINAHWNFVTLCFARNISSKRGAILTEWEKGRLCIRSSIRIRRWNAGGTRQDDSDDSGWQLKASRQNRFIFNSTSFFLLNFVVANAALLVCIACILSRKGCPIRYAMPSQKSQTKSTGQYSFSLSSCWWIVDSAITCPNNSPKDHRRAKSHTHTLFATLHGYYGRWWWWRLCKI